MKKGPSRYSPSFHQTYVYTQNLYTSDALKLTASYSIARVACIALTAEAANSVCAISIQITVVHFKVTFIDI